MRLGVALAVLAVIVVGAAVAWSHRAAGGPGVTPPPAEAPRQAAPAWVPADGPIVAWSADTRARFEPCGCVAGMYGGLSRRATLLARIPAGRLLSLELGGWSGGARAHERLRTAFYLRGLARAGISAVGLGAAEVRLGARVLGEHLRAAADAGLAVTACNLRPAGPALPLRDLIEVAVAGRRFAVTAVVPADAHGDGLAAGDPADAVAGLLPRLDGRSLVVMADLDEAGLAQLAQAVPGIALVVGGAVTTPTQSPLSAGSARVVHAANHGKTVGWWPWGATACRFDLIPDALAEDPRQRELLQAYQAALGSATLDIDQDASGPIPGEGYVGSAACTTCHAQAETIHAASGHHRSLAAVQGRGYGDDPDCLRCHVTGIDAAGGWRRLPGRAMLAEVGCEACHGPGQAHVSSQARTRPVSQATCAACHDAENSPAFAYGAYWPRIRHGR